MPKYRPNGQRRLGIPLNRLLDMAKTGPSRPNSRRMTIITMMVMMMIMNVQDSATCQPNIR
jgi:hypothetical protein